MMEARREFAPRGLGESAEIAHPSKSDGAQAEIYRPHPKSAFIRADPR
jgi:hypothetical protein